MAEFTSRFPSLGFYVDDNVKYFAGGRYVTVDPAEIAVLESITDAVREDAEDIPQVLTEVSAETVEETPAPKPRKTTSAK